MSVKNCIHCGSMHSHDSECCSSGCDLARRLPMSDGALPASWQLGVILGWGFLLFNQALFAGLEFLAIGRGDTDWMGKAALFSNLAGLAVVATSVFLFAISKPKLLSDWQVLALSGAIAFVVWGRFGHLLRDPVSISFTLANLLVCLWLTRGLWRFSTSKKSQKN